MSPRPAEALLAGQKGCNRRGAQRAVPGAGRPDRRLRATRTATHVGPTWRNRTTRPRPRPIRSRSSTRPASTGWWSTRRHIPQGRRHDFKVYKMKHPTFPDNLPCGNAENAGRFDRNCLRHYGDTAYIAMRKVVPGTGQHHPHQAQARQGPDPEPARIQQGALQDPHTRGERHPEDQDIPDHEGPVQEPAGQVRPHQRHRLRGGQPDHPDEESRDPLSGVAAGRPRAGAA